MISNTLTAVPPANNSGSSRHSSQSPSGSSRSSSSHGGSTFGRIVACRPGKSATKDLVHFSTGRSAPTFGHLVKAGGLTLKQAERLMAEAMSEDAVISYAKPSVLGYHLMSAVLALTLLTILGTFVALMMS